MELEAAYAQHHITCLPSSCFLLTSIQVQFYPFFLITAFGRTTHEGPPTYGPSRPQKPPVRQRSHENMEASIQAGAVVCIFNVTEIFA